MIQTETQIRVRICETDFMGIAHHSNYVNWFEATRVDMLRQLGMDYRDFAENGQHLTVIEANCKYFRPAKFNDLLTIKLTFAAKPKIKVTFDYNIFHHDDLIAEGYTRHAFVNDKGRPIRPPQEFYEKLSHRFTTD